MRNSWKKTLHLKLFLFNPETEEKDLIMQHSTDPQSFFETFSVPVKNMLVLEDPKNTGRLVVREVDGSKQKYMIAEVTSLTGETEFTHHHPFGHILRRIYNTDNFSGDQ